MRRVYIEAWRKQRAGLTLEPLELQIAAVVLEHPEYHALLEDVDRALGHEAGPESGQSNPFLHMGMHLAIREQLSTNRPAGIMAAFQGLRTQLGDPHQAEHHIMECLGEALWRSGRTGLPPDEAIYLACIKDLTKKK